MDVRSLTEFSSFAELSFAMANSSSTCNKQTDEITLYTINNSNPMATGLPLPYSVLCASPQFSWNVLVFEFEVKFPSAVVSLGSSPAIK